MEITLNLAVIGSCISILVAIGTAFYRIGALSTELKEAIKVQSEEKKKREQMEKDINKALAQNHLFTDNLNDQSKALAKVTAEHNTTSKSLVRIETILEAVLKTLEELKMKEK